MGVILDIAIIAIILLVLTTIVVRGESRIFSRGSDFQKKKIEKLSQKRRFFDACSPSKLLYIGKEGF